MQNNQFAEGTTKVVVDGDGVIVSAEKSIIYLKDLTHPYMDELHEVPLSNTPIDIDTDLEEIEEVDHLSPLIVDNHTVLEHHELFKESVLNNIKEFHPATPALYRPPPMKHCDTKDSAAESDVSVSSYERRRDSNESAHNEYSSDAISSDENAKDSGCDVTNIDAHNNKEDDEDNGPIEIPDDEMAEKIVAQVEFYFSNENILKDAFLLKHVRRNKEGFVSLKLISSFKRVRQLTKDWRVVGYAIKLKSKNIEVNDLGTKVRRIDALPVFDETMPSRTVVATDLPLDKLTIEKVSEMFSHCGEIALIRILHAGGTIPPDVRQFINKYPELQQKECALVEFTESSSARNALSLDGDMQIFEMVAPKKKTGKKASVSKLIENYIYGDIERSRAGSIDYSKMRRNSSNFYVKPEHVCSQQQQQSPHQPQLAHHQQMPPQLSPRKFSYNNESYEHFNRRPSATSISGGVDMSRKYSNCSEGYSSCSDMSRRTSCSDMSRRPSNCSEAPVFSRRSSNCSDFCPCSRRSSQCSDQFRRLSQCSGPEHNNRRFSNTSMNFERRMSGSDGSRRVSFDSDYDRKISVGSGGCDHFRKTSSNYDPMMRKYSNGEQYIRKISTDSGYDRKLSTGSISDYGSSPRSRSNSFMLGVSKTENLVRTPIGPDGSKGFSSRARKVGHVAV